MVLEYNKYVIFFQIFYKYLYAFLCMKVLHFLFWLLQKITMSLLILHYFVNVILWVKYIYSSSFQNNMMITIAVLSRQSPCTFKMKIALKLQGTLRNLILVYEFSGCFVNINWWKTSFGISGPMQRMNEKKKKKKV